MEKKVSSKVLIIVVVVFIIIVIGAMIIKNRQTEQNIVKNNQANNLEEMAVAENSETPLLGMDNIEMGDTDEEVIEALGEPESKEKIETGFKDVEETRLIYDGGDTTILIRNNKVVEIHSTSVNRRFYNGTGISISQSKLEELMPANLKVQDPNIPDDSIVYADLNAEEYQYVRFATQQGEVVEIVIAIGDKEN